MSEWRYLWDQSDPPDAFVARLERELAAPRARVKAAGRRTRWRMRRRVAVLLAASAAAIFTAAVLWQSGDGGAQPAPIAPAVAIEEISAPADLKASSAVALQEAAGAEKKIPAEAPAQPALEDGVRTR